GVCDANRLEQVSVPLPAPLLQFVRERARKKERSPAADRPAACGGGLAAGARRRARGGGGGGNVLWSGASAQDGNHGRRTATRASRAHFLGGRLHGVQCCSARALRLPSAVAARPKLAAEQAREFVCGPSGGCGGHGAVCITEVNYVAGVMTCA